MLNAKFHEQEANIVAQAGRAGAVTIATNMAGRGTDILLGGNPDNLALDILVQKGIDPEEATDEQRAAARAEAKETCAREAQIVRDAGGLAVIGTERHESRRIDNQLRGRSGRQGDPGSAQFYLSLEDDLMRLFGGDRMDKIGALMQRTSIDDDMPIQAKMVTKGIESAQRQVEAMHFSARKHVLEYDDVMDQQRKTIYAERNSILDGKDYGERVPELIADTVSDAVNEFCPARVVYDEWDMAGLNAWYKELTGVERDLSTLDHQEETQRMTEVLVEDLQGVYDAKKALVPEDLFKKVENQVMLRVIDTRWMAHLSEMDYLRAGIGLRAIGQRDPLVEYKEEAFNAFGVLVSGIYEDFIRTILRLQVNIKVDEPEESEDQSALSSVSYSAPDEDIPDTTRSVATGDIAGQAANSVGQVPTPAQGKTQTVVKDKDDIYANVGRNDPCPCGSGKKFKKCHGANR